MTPAHQKHWKSAFSLFFDAICKYVFRKMTQMLVFFRVCGFCCVFCWSSRHILFLEPKVLKKWKLVLRFILDALNSKKHEQMCIWWPLLLVFPLSVISLFLIWVHFLKRFVVYGHLFLFKNYTVFGGNLHKIPQNVTHNTFSTCFYRAITDQSFHF